MACKFKEIQFIKIGESMSDKPKFTLENALHRVQKLTIKLDVVIDGKVVENHPVGWVKIRGSQDPKYLEKATPCYFDFQAEVESLKDEKDLDKKTQLLKDATELLQIQSVTVAIVDWDKDFFLEDFTPEKAVEVFSNTQYSPIYNQIANYMQQRESFLPLASIQQENG